MKDGFEMKKMIFALILGILFFLKIELNKICICLENLDEAMQQIHIELYKFRMGAEEEWSNTI